MTDDGTTPLARLLAERACERLVVDFVHRLDLGDPGSVADLFTPDGVWEWAAGNRRVAGRAALRAYFAGRPADRLSRRQMTNILVTLTSPDTATGISYLATYRIDGFDGTMTAPRPPANVGHYEDTFRRVGDTWLLAHRRTFLPFGASTERVGPGRPPTA